jgi:hypothetical protein
MKPWFWNLLLVLALALAGGKLFSAISASPPPLPVPAEVSGKASPLPAVRATVPPRTYGEIVDRNLFSAKRGKVEPPVEATAAPVVPKAVPPPKATLFGIVMDDSGEKYAYLTDDSSSRKGKPKKYREGDTFAGAVINEILHDRVIMSSGATKHTVSLRAPKTGIEAYRPPGQPRQQAVQPAARSRTRSSPAEVRSRREQIEEARRSRRSSVRRRRLERPNAGAGDEDGFPREESAWEEDEFGDDDDGFDDGYDEEFDEEDEEW